MMKMKLLFIAGYVLIFFSAFKRGGDGRIEILLWPNGAPGSESKKDSKEIVWVYRPTGDHVVHNIHNPSITLFLPDKNKAPGIAVIIAPGGGHKELWIDHEGYNVAEYLQGRGIAAFVLKYRLAKDSNSVYTVEKDELADMQRAIRLVKTHAKEWLVDPARLGVMGFSAGGELAGLASMRFDEGNPAATDSVDRQSSRPAFQALVYPGNSRSLDVAKHAPPLFLLAGNNDREDISAGVAELYLKYKKANIPAEMHIYSGVGHGFGQRSSNQGPVSKWLQQFTDWVNEIPMTDK